MTAPIVFLTRPKNHNENLVKLLDQTKIPNVNLPVLEIKFLKLNNFVLAVNDIVVFVSRNAVKAYFQQDARKWPVGVWAAAVGQVTATELEQYVSHKQILAPGFESSADSEALFELIYSMGLPKANLHVLRAQTGRNWLAEKMRELGWHTNFYQAYERNHIIWSKKDCAAFALAKGNILLLTSLDAAAALEQSLKMHGLEWPDSLYLITLHQRIANHIQYTYSILNKSLSTVVTKANDEDILDAIVTAYDKLS